MGGGSYIILRMQFHVAAKQSNDTLWKACFLFSFYLILPFLSLCTFPCISTCLLDHFPEQVCRRIRQLLASSGWKMGRGEILFAPWAGLLLGQFWFTIWRKKREERKELSFLATVNCCLFCNREICYKLFCKWIIMTNIDVMWCFQSKEQIVRRRMYNK